MALRRRKPTSPGRRFQTTSDFSELTTDRPEKSLLDTLLDAGIQMDHSCCEGVCGSCETRVLEGIPDHRDSVLSPKEKASNKVMMVCVSGCKSERLVLDI